jgi:hypothetical protein
MLKQFSIGIPWSWSHNDSKRLLLKLKDMRTVWRTTPKDYPVSNILVRNILIVNTLSQLGFEEYETVVQIKFICDITTYLLHKSKLFLSFEGDYRRSLFAGTEIAYKDFVWYYQFSTGNHNRGSHSIFESYLTTSRCWKSIWTQMSYKDMSLMVSCTIWNL